MEAIAKTALSVRANCTDTMPEATITVTKARNGPRVRESIDAFSSKKVWYARGFCVRAGGAIH